MNKLRVQEQFGSSAAAYFTSQVHAKGRSLAKLVNTLKPEKDWRILDVATAAGHTAYTFAPHVRQVVATDITFEMLQLSDVERRKRNANNVVLLSADAENLPFIENYFDVVTCRIAAHHFPDVARFVSESTRVLRPGSKLVIVDNVVPERRYHSKKGKRKVDVGRYVNSFETLRDPSHVRCLSIIEWQQQFEQAGFTVVYQEVAQKKMDFEEWADRMNVTVENQTRLRVMLQQAPDSVLDFLEPAITGNNIEFFLEEAIVVGVLPGP